MPDIKVPKMSEVADIMTRGGAETLQPTAPASLTPAQDQSVRQAVQQLFPASWAVSLKGLDSGRKADGSLVTCGIYNASKSGGDKTLSGIFRAETDPLTAQTVVREAAHTGGKKLAAFSNCQALDLF
ncbi:hypothetical protein [Fulvimarina sp. MAC3]|uniref:hypothetical protein n=1 Tax=Fulvimarina sp. MAC3 TaxID=3148887 RepID=UPI0031FBE0E3